MVDDIPDNENLFVGVCCSRIDRSVYQLVLATGAQKLESLPEDHIGMA